MKNRQNYRLRLEWTIALTLFFVLCYGAFCDSSQQALADDVLRLRVIANSDSEIDQTVKLHVRDRVLALIQPLEQQADSREEAQALVRAHMQKITNAAQREVYASGSSDTVTACLAESWYPTREYDSFSLPAGTYQGLQIHIGDAKGHNWWCVLYPSLCLSAADGEEDLPEDELALIHQDGTAYEIRFRTTELLGSLRGMIE